MSNMILPVRVECSVCEDGHTAVTHFVPNTFACSACGRSWQANNYMRLNRQTLRVWHDCMQGIVHEDV